MKNNQKLYKIIKSVIREVYPDDSPLDKKDGDDLNNPDAPTDDQNGLDDQTPIEGDDNSTKASDGLDDSNGDDLENIDGGGDIGNIGGGGFGGGGGFDSIGSADSSDDNDTGGTLPSEEDKDPVTSIVNTMTKLSSKTNDVPTLLKFLKAGVQNKLPNPMNSKPVLDKLKQSGNASLADAADRFQKFLLIKQEGYNLPMKKKLENLSEQELRTVVRRFIDKKVQKLQEGSVDQIMASMPSVTKPTSAGNSTFAAERSLGVKAKEAALAFESDMVKELDLVNPNDMDLNSQKIYKEVMDAFHDKFVAAVVDAVNGIKILPKNEHEEQGQK